MSFLACISNLPLPFLRSNDLVASISYLQLRRPRRCNCTRFSWACIVFGKIITNAQICRWTTISLDCFITSQADLEDFSLLSNACERLKLAGYKEKWLRLRIFVKSQTLWMERTLCWRVWYHTRHTNFPCSRMEDTNFHLETNRLASTIGPKSRQKLFSFQKLFLC